MIKKLRIKFIILSTGSLLLLLGIIVVSSNFWNYLELVANADMVIGVIADNGAHSLYMLPPEKINMDHTFDNKEMKQEVENLGRENQKEENVPEPLEKEWQKDIPPQGRGWGNRHMSPEILYESRFFTVDISADGKLSTINTESIAMVDEEEAAQYAQIASRKKDDRGFVGEFRYLKIYQENDICVIFLDCGRSLSAFRGTLFTNCMISFAGFLVISVFIVIFSKRIVLPVSESYEKQKQFISVAGHELKTPVTIIDADAELLAMEIGENNEWLQDICIQTKRMTALTNDLLSLSRMDEGRQQFTMIDFPISDVVGETVQSFQTLAKSKGRNIRTEIMPMLTCRGDEGSIRQIVGILLDNAIKYTKENSDKCCKDIVLKLEKKNHNLVLSVRNAAVPVSDEQLKKFFDRFYRTEQSRNSEKGGYGLGLSIAKSIVEAHKGRITASAPDTETVQITVLLPKK